VTNDTSAAIASLDDLQLVVQARSLAGRSRQLTARLVALLAEVDRRGIALRDGTSSLHAWCVQELRLSDGEAYERIHAARAARRFPHLLALLCDGQLTLTAVTILAPHLTNENHRDVLEAARGKSKAQVQDIVAALAPRPDVPTSLRKLPSPRPVSAPAATRVPAAAAPPPRPAVVVPLAPERYKFETTLDGEARALYEMVRDLLGPSVASGELLKRVLAIAASELTRQKFALTDKPRESGGVEAGSRHVPAAVKREVWLRDGGRCAYVSPGGRRCDSRYGMEFHHVTPFAAGGTATIEGIQLRCRAHNQMEADLYFDRGRREAALDLLHART
jgi:hypothetical protein